MIKGSTALYVYLGEGPIALLTRPAGFGGCTVPWGHYGAAPGAWPSMGPAAGRHPPLPVFTKRTEAGQGSCADTTTWSAERRPSGGTLPWTVPGPVLAPSPHPSLSPIPTLGAYPLRKRNGKVACVRLLLTGLCLMSSITTRKAVESWFYRRGIQSRVRPENTNH